MNLEKLDPKTMTLIVLACTAVVLGVLVIDVQIAKQLAERARTLDAGLRFEFERQRVQDEVSRNGGNPSGTAFRGNHGGDSVDGNPGVEAGADSPDSEVPQGWDIFPATRTNFAADTGAGIRRVAIPQSRGTVES